VRLLIAVLAAAAAALALAACGDSSTPAPAAAPPPAATAATADAAQSTLRPPLRRLEDDRGEAHTSGCHLKTSGRTRSPGARCVFGAKDSPVTVVNIGDSHALMYAPAMIALARQHGWRLVNLTRAGCTIADVDQNDRCNPWRRDALRRLVRERPDLVVVSNGMLGDRYRVRLSDGRHLSRRASQPKLEAGLARSLRRMRATGAAVVVIRDMAKAPSYDTGACLRRHRDAVDRCAFRATRPEGLAFDARAAERVDGVTLADPLPVLCPDGRCPMVAGDVIVYRNGYHLSATYAETLAPWIASQLPPALVGG